MQSRLSISTLLSTSSASPRSVTEFADGWRVGRQSVPGLASTPPEWRSWRISVSLSLVAGGNVDFSLPAGIDSLRQRVRDFVAARIIPLEADPANFDAHENISAAVLEQVREEVRAAG